MNKIGIIGNPLSHTLSPVINNSAIKYFNLNLSFEKWELEINQLEKFFKNAYAQNIIGGCITIPHKENVLKFYEDFDDSVKRIGSSNWFKVYKNKIVGFNTDYIGFQKSIPKSYINNFNKKNCTVFGAGGSAKAVIESLFGMKAKSITIINRSLEKAELISKKYKDIKIITLELGSDIAFKYIESSDVIVNTTSVGMSSGPNPEGNLIKGFNIKKNVLGIDLVYSPFLTPFLKSIKNSGGEIVNGIDMLIYQAQSGFEILTEKKCPFEIMKSALKLN